MAGIELANLGILKWGNLAIVENTFTMRPLFYFLISKCLQSANYNTIVLAHLTNYIRVEVAAATKYTKIKTVISVHINES